MEMTNVSKNKMVVTVSVKEHKTEDGYRVEVEQYPGVYKSVCEWVVWNPEGRMTAYDVTYGLAEAKKLITAFIEQDRAAKQ